MNVCAGNGTRVAVKAIGTIRLVSDSGSFLDLEEVYCIPSMRRNLVSISSLVKADYGFNIDLASGIKISRASAVLLNDY